MKFKKLVSLGLITVMAASLAACGDSGSNNTVVQGVGNGVNNPGTVADSGADEGLDNNGGLGGDSMEDSDVIGGGKGGGYATTTNSITVAEFDDSIDMVGKVKYLVGGRTDDSIIIFEHNGKMTVDDISSVTELFSEPYEPSRFINDGDFYNMESKKEEIAFLTRNELVYKNKDGSYTMIDLRPTKQGETYKLELNGGEIIDVKWNIEYKTNAERIVFVILKDNKLTFELYGKDCKHLKSIPVEYKNYKNSSSGEKIDINIKDIMLDTIENSEGFKIVDTNGVVYENASSSFTGYFDLDDFKDEAWPEGVENVALSAKVDKLYYHGGINTLIYSKEGDDKNLYSKDLSSLNKEGVEYAIAMPEGYTLDNIAELYVNSGDVMIVFTDKNVYVWEQNSSPYDYKAPVLLEDVTALNKKGVVKQFGVADVADCAGFIFLGDDNTLYSIDW